MPTITWWLGALLMGVLFVYLVFSDYVPDLVRAGRAAITNPAVPALQAVPEQKLVWPQTGWVSLHYRHGALMGLVRPRLYTSDGSEVRIIFASLHNFDNWTSLSRIDEARAQEWRRDWLTLLPDAAFAVPRAGQYRLTLEGLDRLRRFEVQWRDGVSGVVATSGESLDEAVLHLRSGKWHTGRRKFNEDHRAFYWKGDDGRVHFVSCDSSALTTLVPRLTDSAGPPPDVVRETPRAELYSAVRVYLVANPVARLAGWAAQPQQLVLALAFVLSLAAVLYGRDQPGAALNPPAPERTAEVGLGQRLRSLGDGASDLYQLVKDRLKGRDRLNRETAQRWPERWQPVGVQLVAASNAPAQLPAGWRHFTNPAGTIGIMAPADWAPAGWPPEAINGELSLLHPQPEPKIHVRLNLSAQPASSEPEGPDWVEMEATLEGWSDSPGYGSLTVGGRVGAYSVRPGTLGSRETQDLRWFHVTRRGERICRLFLSVDIVAGALPEYRQTLTQMLHTVQWPPDC